MKNILILFIDEVDNQIFHLKPVGFYFDACFDRNIKSDKNKLIFKELWASFKKIVTVVFKDQLK